MTTDRPATLEDTMHRATGFIELEENRAAMSKKLASKQPTTKEKPADEYVEPRQHYDDSYMQDFKEKRASSFLIGDRDQQELDSQPRLPNNQWNKYVRTAPTNSSKGSKTTFCDFHNIQGHSTEQCRHLQDILYREYLRNSASKGKGESQPTTTTST